MRIIGRDLIEQFQRKHPDSASSLSSWKQACEASTYKHFADLRRTFGSADFVPPHTVFDISGNKYRLIAIINYTVSAIQVTHIMKHSDYDKGRWRKQR